MPLPENPHLTPRPSATAGRALSFLVATPPTGAPLKGRLTAVAQLFELAETLGYDHGWLRPGGDVPSAASAVTVLAAIGQRTQVIGLGAAVPLPDLEHPAALTAALRALDDLTDGRVHVALSAADGHGSDPAGSLLDALDGTGQLWGVAATPSAAARAAQQGLRLLATDVVPGLPASRLAGAQQAVLRAYRDVAGRGGRTAVARALLPTDSAGRAARNAYLSGQTGALAGSSGQLAEHLAADAAVAEADELVVLLPGGLPAAAHAQILHDVAAYVAPETGFGGDAAVPGGGGSDEPTSPLKAGASAKAGRAA